MTNDRFLAFLYNILNIGIAPMSDEQSAYEHAKKLVALVETAKRIQHYDCAVRGEDDCDLCKAIKDLERE